MIYHFSEIILYIKKKILYIVLCSNFHYFKTFFSIRCQKRFVKIIENSSNPLNLKFQLDRLPTNKKLAYHVVSTSLLSHVFLEKTYSGKKKKAGKTPLGAGVALELQGGITWYSIKETSPWREQGSLRGELVFAWRDVGEYLRRWRRRATFPCSRHWGLVAKQLEQVLLERKGVLEPSTLISALVAARNDECEMCVTMRGYDASEDGNGWRRGPEGRKRGYLAVPWNCLAGRGISFFPIFFRLADGISFAVRWLITRETFILNIRVLVGNLWYFISFFHKVECVKGKEHVHTMLIFKS